MGICNKIAGILAPVLIGTLVLHGIGDLSAGAGRRRGDQGRAAQRIRRQDPCAVPGDGRLLVVLAVACCSRRCRKSSPSEANATPWCAGAAERRSIFQFPHLWLGVLCLFVYVGVEVMAGDAIGTYGHGFGLPLDQTKMFTSLTLGAMLAGYVVGLLLIPGGLAVALPDHFGGAGRGVLPGRLGHARLRVGGLRGRCWALPTP
jgi:fucose permease